MHAAHIKYEQFYFYKLISYTRELFKLVKVRLLPFTEPKIQFFLFIFLHLYTLFLKILLLIKKKVT